jgi:hypothetical protein
LLRRSDQAVDLKGQVAGHAGGRGEHGRHRLHLGAPIGGRGDDRGCLPRLGAADRVHQGHVQHADPKRGVGNGDGEVHRAGRAGRHRDRARARTDRGREFTRGARAPGDARRRAAREDRERNDLRAQPGERGPGKERGHGARRNPVECEDTARRDHAPDEEQGRDERDPDGTARGGSLCHRVTRKKWGTGHRRRPPTSLRQETTT